MGQARPHEGVFARYRAESVDVSGPARRGHAGRADGQYIVPPVYDEPAILTATLDTAALDAERMTLDVAGHYGRPDVFEFDVRRGPR